MPPRSGNCRFRRSEELQAARRCRPEAAQGRPESNHSPWPAHQRLGYAPDLKNRRPPSLRDLLEPFGPGAYAAATEGIASIPKTMDRLRPKMARALDSASTSWLAAKAPCKGPGPKLRDSKKTDLGNGASFELHLELGDQASAGFAIQGKAKDGSDRTVRLEVDFDLCDSSISLSLPECPTAEGKLDGSGSTKFTLTVSTLKDGAVEHSYRVELAYKIKLKGQVAVDAKLDWVDIEHTFTVKRSSSRESILWGPSTEQGRVERTTRVNMRTGSYDLGKANVLDVSFQYSGILSILVQDRLAQARIAAELAKQSDEEFAQTVKAIIDEYQNREKAWQTPNKCATLEFDPASRSLRVRDGQTGTVKGTIKATRGGVAKDGRWRRQAQRHVNVTPTQAPGAQPSFSYRVLDAERGISATFRATSPAGVAAGDWVQGGEDFPARFSGTFTGENRTAARNTYSGTITFVRNASSPAGTVTYRVERVSWSHRITSLPESPCRFEGSTTVSIANPDRRLSVLAITKGKQARGYRYAITAMFQSPRQLTIDAVCNGTPFKQPWVPGGALYTSSDEYTDLKTIKGRHESTATASTYTWNLKASS